MGWIQGYWSVVGSQRAAEKHAIDWQIIAEGYIMMQVKGLVSALGVLALAAVGLAGDPYRGHYGGPCGKGEAESQKEE